jgi:hypothetical protein
VLALFHHRKPSAVRRYVLPKLCALNFVLDHVLDSGVNDSLNLDSHGKTLAFLLLSLEVAVPGEIAALLNPIAVREAECSSRKHTRGMNSPAPGRTRAKSEWSI